MFYPMDETARTSPPADAKGRPCLAIEGKAIYNPFDTGSEKAAAYDQWCVLMDAGRMDEADKIFQLHHNGMTYAERNRV